MKNWIEDGNGEILAANNSTVEELLKLCDNSRSWTLKTFKGDREVIVAEYRKAYL